MSSKLPWLKFYYGDFLGSSRVQALPAVERGFYALLILHATNLGGSLPIDEKALLRLIGGTEEDGAALGRVVREFFRERDGRLENGRLTEVLKETAELTQKKSESSRKANRVRWGNRPSNGGVSARTPPGLRPDPILDVRCQSSESDVREEEEMSTDKPSTRQRVDWKEHLERWNRIAKEADLPQIKSLNKKRKPQLRARLSESPTFWRDVEEKIKSRSQWARDRRFPAFDQVLNPGTLAKLVEGNYDGRKTSWTDEELRAMP